MENYDQITYLISHVIYVVILIGFYFSWNCAGFYFRLKDKFDIHIIIFVCFIFFMLWLYVEHFDWCLHNVQVIVDIFLRKDGRNK